MNARKANTRLRRIGAQKMRYSDNSIKSLYSQISIGDRLTPEEIKTIVVNEIKPSHEISTRKAVLFFHDLFVTQRCKIKTAGGKRINGWEVIDDFVSL